MNNEAKKTVDKVKEKLNKKEPETYEMMGSAVVKYDLEQVVLDKLKEKYGAVEIRPGNEKDYEVVLDGLREFRNIRVAVNKWHKDEKKAALEYGKKVDAEKNRVLGLFHEDEERLKDIRKAEDERKEKEEREAEEKERQRIQDIQAMLMDIKLSVNVVGLTSQEIEERITEIEEKDLDQFDEFKDTAEATIAEATVTLNDLYIKKCHEEKEAEALAEEKKKQEAERQALEKKEKELEKKKAKIEAEESKKGVAGDDKENKQPVAPIQDDAIPNALSEKVEGVGARKISEESLGKQKEDNFEADIYAAIEWTKRIFAVKVPTIINEEIAHPIKKITEMVKVFRTNMQELLK